MNNKRSVGPSRYKPLTEQKWETLPEYKIGRTVLTKGRHVKITGQRGGIFAFQYAQRNVETGDVTLAFVGGRSGHVLDRFFKPEQVKQVLKW